MKKRHALLIAICLICLLLCALCACDKGNIPGGVPVGWQTYLNEVTTIVANEMNTCENNINLNLNGSLEVGGKRYQLEMRSNNGIDNQGDNNFALTLTNASGEKVIAVCANGQDTYVDVAQNPYIDNAKLKLQQTCVFDWLYRQNQTDGTTIADRIQQDLTDFGKTLFNGANVNADKSKYTFMLDGEGLSNRVIQYFKALSFYDEDVSKVILSIFGIRDIDAMFAGGDIDGQVDCDINDGRLTAIECQFSNETEDNVGKLNLDIAINDEYDEDVAEMFPKSDIGYKITKVGSTALDGGLSLISTDGNKYAVKYDMSMNANIDLLTLIFNGFDLEKLGDDNFFHFRLSHVCASACSEYCDSKLSKANGAVLDIAYSPKYFGSTNVYICVNLHAVLRKSLIDQVARYDRSVTPTNIPEYAMAVLPASKLKGDESLMRIMFKAYAKIVGIEVGKSEFVDFDRDELNFDNALLNKFASNVFESEEYQIDRVKLRVDENIYGQARDYDIYKEVVYLKGYDIPELKSFNSALCKDHTAYSWTYEEKKTTQIDGVECMLNNVYDASGSNLLHGVDENGNYVPMSDKEIEDLIGSTLKLDYVGYGKESKSAYCEIIGVEGLNPQSYEVQTVVFKVKYPNMLDYSFEVGDIEGKVLEDLLGGGGDTFAQDVLVNIKLTRESSVKAFEFHSADTDKKYRLTYNSTVPEMLMATATINYENGLKKDVLTIGKSSSVIETGLFVSRYSVVEWGKITVKFRVAGRNVERYFDVEKPSNFEFSARDGSNEMGTGCYLTSFVTLKAVYDDAKINISMSLNDFYINNICVDETTADWSHYYTYNTKNLVFNKSNDYIVNVKKCGINFGKFTLHVTSTSTKNPTYQYNVKSEPQDVVLQGAQNIFSGTITNKTRGDSQDKTYTLEVKVYEYSSSGSSLSYAEAQADSYTLNMTVGGQSVDNGKLQIVLPSMIIDPINVRLQLTFSKKSIYRVVIRLNLTTLYQFNISVM